MYKRIVVKVGTKVITDAGGKIDPAVLKHLVRQITLLRQQGIQIILVTSGAMAAGRSTLFIKGEERVEQKQVLASVGQVKLMSTYSSLFGEYGFLCAQILVTKEDFRDKVHYNNMQNCFENLLKNNVVPVVNENDTIATTELLFTDNDELAGLIASQLDAEALIILTDVEGVLTGDPKDKSSRIISEIDFKNINSYQKYVSPEKSSFGRGGMLTKFGIAKKLAVQGIATYIVSGKKNNILMDLINGEKIGTKFNPQKKTSSLKRRLAYSEGIAKGAVVVNKCTKEMLLSKTKIMSLLPVGVVGVEGNFKKGDTIEIKSERGQKLGFGIAQYDFLKAKELAGKKNVKPVIHYNYMFING